MEIIRRDPAMAVWWGTPVECTSGIARLQREGVLTAGEARSATHSLLHLADSWWPVQPTEWVAELAQRLVRVHPLRAGDSLQLAAALIWAGEVRAGAVMVTLDRRLAVAADLEGLRVEGLSLAD